MFVSRMLLDSCARSARVYCRAERENRARESLFPFLPLRARRFLLTKNRTLRSLSGSLYYRVGRPPQRDVDFRRETSRKLNRNFERSFSSRQDVGDSVGTRSFSRNDYSSQVPLLRGDGRAEAQRTRVSAACT